MAGLRTEFLRDPFVFHSRELQLLLGAMRSNNKMPRYVLLVIEPGKRWQLAVASPVRGVLPTILDGVRFDDLAEAERYVFDLRWVAMGGALGIND